MSLSEDARSNRQAWGGMAAEYVPSGRRDWADIDFPLIEGSAEAVPLPDDSFDVAISELLGRCGFTVHALHELKAPEGATTRYTFVTPEWARRWPSEEIWVARLGE